MKFFIYLVATVAVLGALFVLFKPSGEAPVSQVKDPASSTAAAPPGTAPTPSSAVTATPGASAPVTPNAAPTVPNASPASPVAPSGNPTPPGGAPAATNNVAAAPAAPPDAGPAPQVFDLSIRRGRLVDGPTVIKVHKNDKVVINLTADVADELHLHGYDLNVKMRPGEKATLRFNATKTGRFGYELHHAKAELGALEVYPR